MGQISTKLAARMKENRKLADELRREAKSIQGALDALQRGGRPWTPRGEELNPLHAIYTAVQKFTSFFAERVRGLREFEPHCELVAEATGKHRTSGPQGDPLPLSYLTPWALYDARFGRDDETMGTCLLDICDLLGLEPGPVEAISLMNESRMGIYERGDGRGNRIPLRELITDDHFDCYVPGYYSGYMGDILYVRLCPPIPPADYHVAITRLYTLRAGKRGWSAYLREQVIGSSVSEARRRLHELLKYGREPNQWNQFIFDAYEYEHAGGIFLKDLPDGQRLIQPDAYW